MAQDEEHQRKRDLHIVVLGDRGAGKTTFTSQTIISTRSANYIKTKKSHVLNKEMFIEIDGWRSPISLSVYDTPGSRRHQDHTCPLTQCHLFERVDAVVILYDITQSRSFHSLDWWFSRIAPICADKLTKSESFPVVLVGSKLDYLEPDDSKSQESPRKKGKSKSVQMNSPPLSATARGQSSPALNAVSPVHSSHLKSFTLTHFPSLPEVPAVGRARSMSPMSPLSPRITRFTMRDFNCLRQQVIRWCNERRGFQIFTKFCNLHKTRDVNDVIDLISEQFTEEFTPRRSHKPEDVGISPSFSPNQTFLNTNLDRQVVRLHESEMDDDEIDLWSDAGETQSEASDDEMIARLRSISMMDIDSSPLFRRSNRSIEADFTVRAPLWVQTLMLDS